MKQEKMGKNNGWSAAAGSRSGLGSVDLTVINNRFTNLCEEMGLAMMKTAYSPIFNEGLDFTCVVFNRDVEILAQGEFCPAQVGAIMYALEWTVHEMGIETFHEGDVVIQNDPYRGNTHIPEHMVVKPIFYEGELQGFVGNIAHLSEIGGMAPGGFAGDATEIYQEGFRMPPIKIVDRGKDVEDVWKVILTNHRTPRTSWGDLRAMIGSCGIAERRFVELLEEYGPETIHLAGKDLFDVAERRMRAEIDGIPDGEYVYEDYMEDEGLTDKSYKIRGTVVVRGDELIVDYTGSDPQARGPINGTYAVAAGAAYNAVFHVTDPSIPHNLGCYKPITTIAPPGTIVNCEHPAPEVGGNTETHPRLVEILFGALSQAIPEKVAASDGGTACNFLFGGIHPDTGQPYANYHLEGVGWGGRYEKDGNDATIIPNGNCRNTPVEVFETRYPLLTGWYRLVQDSGGPGENRGGLGTTRHMRVVAPEITISALMDRMHIEPFGLFEGKGGGNSGLYIKKKGSDEFKTFSEVYGVVSSGKFSGLIAEEGDEIILRSAGGGGYENPLRRDPLKVLDDVYEGWISADSARENYGVVLRGSGSQMQLDNEATDQLRLELAKNAYERAETSDAALNTMPKQAEAPTPTPTELGDGEWRDRNTDYTSYLNAHVVHCSGCGKVVPKQTWYVTADVGELPFCDPACQSLYESYWLSKYGE